MCTIKTIEYHVFPVLLLRLAARYAPPQPPGAHAPGATSASPNDILYYEVLDMPLDQLEQLKTLKVGVGIGFAAVRDCVCVWVGGAWGIEHCMSMPVFLHSIQW
jgi:hypothetical protein